jgi:hypothetical protein
MKVRTIVVAICILYSMPAKADNSALIELCGQIGQTCSQAHSVSADLKAHCVKLLTQCKTVLQERLQEEVEKMRKDWRERGLIK